MRRIEVEVVNHRHTDLLVALSREMPGLTVAAWSWAQLLRDIQSAIREMVEADDSFPPAAWAFR